jgi:hypothetical protein
MGVDPPPAPAAGRRAADLDLAHRRAPRETGAVVALARRLADILYARLRDGSAFEPQRVERSQL